VTEGLNGSSSVTYSPKSKLSEAVARNDYLLSTWYMVHSPVEKHRLPRSSTRIISCRRRPYPSILSNKKTIIRNITLIDSLSHRHHDGILRPHGGRRSEHRRPSWVPTSSSSSSSSSKQDQYWFPRRPASSCIQPFEGSEAALSRFLEEAVKWGIPAPNGW
jgi:hypothetical protein